MSFGFACARFFPVIVGRPIGLCVLAPISCTTFSAVSLGPFSHHVNLLYI